MFPARIAIATATEPATAAAGGTCQTFNAKLKLFQPAAMGSSSVNLLEMANQTFEVTHVGTNAIAQGDEVIVGQTVDERWIVLPSATGSGSSAHPRIQFVTLQQISDRQVQAKVLRTHHNAPDLVGGGLLQYGDTVTLNDPFNLWSEIESGATGWAYLAYAQPDDPSTEEIDEEHIARYEIEECSLPTKEITGYLKSCLYPSQATKEVIVQLDDPSIQASPEFLRSSYPNVDYPPLDEIQTGTGEEGDYTFINAINQYNLDGVNGSKVVLRRVTNRPFSDPENYTCPLARSADTHAWEIVKVEKPFARIIRVSLVNESWVYNNYRADGFLSSDGLSSYPFEECPTISIDGPDNWVCDDPPDSVIGWAIWKVDTQTIPTYQVVHTSKDLIGDPPEAVSIVTNAWMSGCDIAVTKETGRVFCKTGLVVERTPIRPEEKVVLTSGALSITSECGSCSSVVIAKVKNIALVWDGANWVLAAGETCDGSYTAPNNPGPDDPHLVVVPCTTKEWKDTGHCGSNSVGSCSCDRSGRPDASTQSIGATWTGTCTPPSGESQVQLCWSYETETIYTLPCPGAPVTGGDSSCIPLTDCVEEESGGGDTP